MVLRSFSILGVALLIAGVFVGSLFIADHVANDAAVRMLVERYGYFGILATALIAGFNLFVPVPAAVFSPIFIAAGYTPLVIITLIVIGTVLADSLAYLIGFAGKGYVREKWPRVVGMLENIEVNHRKWLLPFVFLYAAFSPIPNEAILVPMALLGIRYKTIIIPLILGGVVHHTILVYGAQGVFETFF